MVTLNNRYAKFLKIYQAALVEDRVQVFPMDLLFCTQQ